MADPYEPYLDRSVVTQAPKFNLSSDDIAQPARTLAHSLDKAGEALTDVSVPLAEEAGTRAGANVRTDDAGNLVYDKAPLVGPASVAYARAARMTALAKITPDVDNKLLELRLQYPNDPAGYQAAASSFVDTLTKSIPDEHLSAAVGKQAGEAAAHNYRTSLVETNSNQVSEALQSYQARLKDINERSPSLARQAGVAGVDLPPEYLSLAHDREQYYQEMVGDKRMGFSKDRADLELKESRDLDVEQYQIGKVQGQFLKDHDLGKAKQSLQNAFWGDGSDKLNLTAQKRDKGITEGLKALSNITAQDRDAIAENRQAVTGYLANLKAAPGSFDEFQHGNMVHRAESIGDYRSIGDLQEAKAFLPTQSYLKSAGPDERATALQTMYRGIVPGTPPPAAADMVEIGKGSQGFFAERGGRFAGTNPEFVGRLRTAVEDAEKATGEKAQINSLKRTTDEQAAAYAHYQSGAGGLAAPPGHSRHEIGEAADIQPGKVLDYLHQNADKYGLEFLKGRAFSADPVHIQLGGGGSLTPGSHVDITEDNAAARLFQSTVRDLRERVTKDAEHAATEIDDIAKRGDSFAPGQLEYFGRLAALSGRDDLVEKIKPALMERDARAGLPEGTTPTALHAEVEAAKKQGLPTVERQALDMLDKQFEHDYTQMHTNPLTYGGAAGWHGTIGNLDAANPDAFAGEIGNREKMIGVDQQKIRNLGPVSAVTPQEGGAVATALTNGDPANAGKLLASFGQLSPDNYRATMASPSIKDAVIGMAGSTDPARMSAGMSTMDRLWRQDPGAFKASYGEGAMTRLQAWQGLKDQFSSQEIAERINSAEDPSKIEAHRKIGAAAAEEIKEDPQQVAALMGSFWNRTFSHSMGDISPNDSMQAQQLSVQFTDTYKALRTYGVEPGKAKELTVKRMGEVWQQSSVAGGQLMMNAPEHAVNKQNGQLYYPAINGSQSWMSDQLHGDLEKIVGPATTVINEGLPEAVASQNWRLRGLIPDAQTKIEISSGRPPRYQVAIDTANGTELINGSDGKPLRFGWDHNAAKAEAMTGLMDRDRRARDRRNFTDTLPNPMQTGVVN